MKLIDNQTILLGDDLKREIKSGSKMRIAASCFSIYAFNELKRELEGIEELRFIFSSPAFAEDVVSDKIKREKREFFLPNELSEKSIYGTEFEVRLPVTTSCRTTKTRRAKRLTFLYTTRPT